MIPAYLFYFILFSNATTDKQQLLVQQQKSSNSYIWVNPLNIAHVASGTHDPQELIERGIVDSFFCFQSTHYPQDPYCPSMSQAPKPKA